MSAGATALHFAHKAIAGVLVAATAWGAYSVAGGTVIILERRWERNKRAKEAEKNQTIQDSATLATFERETETNTDSLRPLAPVRRE